MKTELSVVTLNCWGIPYVSKDRKSRINALAKYLSSSTLDFVCLQEIWSKKDFIFIASECISQLPFTHYFNSGVVGSGLCVLSKYPIVDVYFHQWPINGYAHKIHQGDWFGGKGVGLCKIKVDETIVHVYTAHLHAEYSASCTEYLSQRVLQAFDASQFVKLTSSGSDLVILAGDLNTEPGDLALKLLKLNAQLEDCYIVAQQKSSDCCIGTNESSRNSYTPQHELKTQPNGKRIDYILFNNDPKLVVEVKEYCFPLPKLVPDRLFSYSDHEAVSAVFSIRPVSEINPNLNRRMLDDGNSTQFQSVLNESISVCASALVKLSSTRKKYLYSSSFFGLLLFVFLFVEIFFNIPAEYNISYTSYIVCFNLVKIICTCIFLFSLLMGTLWNKIEKSAILYGKQSMSLISQRICYYSDTNSKHSL